ncbi:hypothetical protein HJG60_011634 [Phyllostomus discolor]|uniref:Uncharacterized protein n=1 Tax=Phyllostomus discolor TaxID=89673 RepID=A0A834DXI9_9CHIR|nr:hypothetical protein HJG60_011634 [Phyllostomus discolor]
MRLWGPGKGLLRFLAEGYRRGREECVLEGKDQIRAEAASAPASVRGEGRGPQALTGPDSPALTHRPHCSLTREGAAGSSALGQRGRTASSAQPPIPGDPASSVPAHSPGPPILERNISQAGYRPRLPLRRLCLTDRRAASSGTKENRGLRAA